ncbi:MAG: AsnC family transcriptional regulator [Thermoplasmatota archaeon]
MDPLDMAILRELARERVMFWGGIDPRLSAGDIARRVHVDRTTVRDRLKAWRDEGFLLEQRVYPSPALLGYTYAAGGLKVAPAAKSAVLDALAGVDGVLTRVEYLGEWIGVGHAFDTPEALAARLALFASLPGVASVQEPFFPPAPPVAVQPTPLDWRVMDALARLGVSSLAAVAADVGVSTRTITRRYERLVRAQALWYVPSLDFTVPRAGVMAKLIVSASPRADERAIAKRLGARFAHAHTIPGHYGDGTAFFEVLDSFHTVGAVEDAEREVSAFPGVAEVESLFPKRFLAGGDWLRDRLAARATAASP